MIKQKYFRTAAFGALAAALAATPAFANEDESEQEVSLEARGTFAGFTGSFDVATDAIQQIEPALDLATLRAEAGIVSTQGNGPQIEPRLISRDDVNPNGAGFVDVGDTQPSVVQLFSQRNSDGGVFLNCTGTLINPRTVITAAHCVNSLSSEDYGLPETGAARTMLIGTGFYTAGRVFEYIDFGSNYAEGGVASSTDVIIHSTANEDEVGLPFPWADVALIALDTPITDIPTMDLLLSPLTELAHVVQVGYGTFGDAFGGGTTGSSLLRRVGENMLGAVANFQDITDVVYANSAPNADLSQVYYFTDFDWPDRDLITRPGDTEPGGYGCVFNGNGAECQYVGDILATDWFDGDALPNEAATAPGDSGSPLIVDQLYDRQVAVAVLSGGITYPGTDLSGIGLTNTYGDISFYNPLYPFFEFISENTAYKYVSAAAGDGLWSDPTRWTQDLDPGFFIDDGTGTLVNGLPQGSEPGIYASGPKLGTVLGVDISGNPEGSLILPPDGVFFGIGSLTPESSVLLGPGSTGFVPNNTDGTPGVSFANPAQYFEVHLNRPGTTTVDMDVEIDKLVVDNRDGGIRIEAPYSFTSVIDVEHWDGISMIDGTLNTPGVYLAGGLIGGSGTINSNAFFNIAGAVSPGAIQNIRTLTINGDYVQTSGGALLVDVKPKGKGNPSDLLQVNGFASIAGLLGVSSLGNAKFDYGTRYTVLEANGIDGQFDAVQSFVNSPVIYFEQIVNADSVQVEVKAHSIARLVGANSSLASLGTTLDTLRTSGRYANYRGLFQAVDNAGFDQFGATLSGLTPVSGFAQSATATNFAMRFAGQLSQRTLALRGDGRAAAGFSSYGSASFAQAGTAPGEASKLGYFGSVSGSFLTQGRERNTGTKAFEEATFSQAGELTLGADYKLSDSVSFGMAVSSVRDGAATTAALQARPNQSTSVAGYGSASFGAGFADAYVGFADQRFGLSREAQGDLTEEFASAMGLADGKQSMAGIRAGYAFKPARGAMIGPVVSLDYVRSQLGGYREYGAGTFGLDVHDRTFTSLGAKVGAMGALDMKLGQKSKLTAFGSLAYARELGDSQDLVTASFVGADDLPFSIARQLDTDWVAVNAGASLEISDDFSTQLSLTSDFGRGELSSRQANVSLNWSF